MNKFNFTLIPVTAIVAMAYLYGLFFIFGFVYEGKYYSNYTHHKLDNFYNSESRASRISNILLGDWDRVCYLQSHKSIDLENILNRELSFTETVFWNFRVDFVDFDHDGGVMVYEKNTNIQKIEFPGTFVSSKSQGCYPYPNTYLEKSVNDKLIIYSKLD